MAEFTQSGGSNGGNYAQYFTAKLTVSESSYDVASNTSVVYWQLDLISGKSGTFSQYYVYSDVYINGVHVLDDEGYKAITSHYATLTLGSGTLSVAHNSDGAKTISCSASIDSASGTYSPRRF